MGHNKPLITDEHIRQINKLINDNPGWNRTAISKRLCEIWGWESPVGQIKDISCRDLLRSLDKKGLINLPAAQRWSRTPGVGADKIVHVNYETKQINSGLCEVAPLNIQIVAAGDDMRMFKSYMRQFHYLGFDRSVGEGIKYIVRSKGGDVLACLMFGSSAWSCRARDDYIGWGAEQRRAGLHLLTNNSRFLILPGVNVPHLASHILGAIARRISADWQTKYGHGLCLLETFVERGRFKGTCYKAANWICVGKTAGMGRNCRAAVGALPEKDVYVYPLSAGFRRALAAQERTGG